MTKERLQAVLLLYGDKIKGDGYKPERIPDANVPPSSLGPFEGAPFCMRHIAWMVGEALRFTEENEIEKAMRWLGFIQGAFWVIGYRTLEQMKADNRMSESGEPKPRKCIGCRIEAEIGTEENPHPVPGQFHTCSSQGSS